MGLQEIIEKMKMKVDGKSGFKARVLFHFTDEGYLFFDTTQDPPTIVEEERDADTTFTCSVQTLDNILDGKQDPNLAFMMGKLKIKGSMGVAMKLNALLED